MRVVYQIQISNLKLDMKAMSELRVGLSMDIHNLKIRFESAQMDPHMDP
jgi:hypothetical protein